MRFYKCNLCGQVISTVNDTGITPFCCDTAMEELIPNTAEIHLSEKHIPVFKRNGNELTVTVGLIPHPMTPEHHIEWILVVTNKGSHKINLNPCDAPVAKIMLDKNEVVYEIYSFCNIHSLWELKR